jgi:hypothetical protein
MEDAYRHSLERVAVGEAPTGPTWPTLARR